jgi:hypothetical protein
MECRAVPFSVIAVHKMRRNRFGEKIPEIKGGVGVARII